MMPSRWVAFVLFFFIERFDVSLLIIGLIFCGRTNHVQTSVVSFKNHASVPTGGGEQAYNIFLLGGVHCAIHIRRPVEVYLIQQVVLRGVSVRESFEKKLISSHTIVDALTN